jgi:hypothetical protein
MKQLAFLAFVALLMIPSLSTSARAEPIPDYALDKDFQNCMGNESPQKDPERAQYCNCVRDGMRNWDLDTYGAVASEQAKASNAQQVPQKIEDLAKACIAKVLK